MKLINNIWQALRSVGIVTTMKHMLRFVFDLIIVLCVATLFMRFFIICSVGQTASLAIGMLVGAAANFYLKFRYKLL